jgi:hypothetical protein
MFQRKYHMNLKFYQITNINDISKITPYNYYNINKFIPYRGYILDIIDLYILDIIVNIDIISSSCGEKDIKYSNL